MMDGRKQLIVWEFLFQPPPSTVSVIDGELAFPSDTPFPSHDPLPPTNRLPPHTPRSLLYSLQRSQAVYYTRQYFTYHSSWELSRREWLSTNCNSSSLACKHWGVSSFNISKWFVNSEKFLLLFYIIVTNIVKPRATRDTWHPVLSLDLC